MFDKSDPSDVDDHLMQMIDMVGALPPALQSHWPRYGSYYDVDGNLIRREILDYQEMQDKYGSGKASEGADEKEDVHAGDTSMGQAESEAATERANPSDSDKADLKSEYTATNPHPSVEEMMSPTLKESLVEEMAGDVDEREIAQILSLMQRALCYLPEERPSAETLLRDPWMQAI